MIPSYVWVVGNRMYAVCLSCQKVVCINKSVFGSLHICVGDEGDNEPL